MKRFLPILVAVAGLVTYGVAEGLWSNRWFSSAALEQAVAKLDGVPRVVGPWEGTDRELDARQVAQAEIAGYVLRRYVNRDTGGDVNVMLVCGRPGPTAVHSPDVCYPGAGFYPAAAPTRHDIAPGTCWVGHFQKQGPVVEGLRIFWAWNADGTWHASESPRWQFARHGALYKLYVTRPLGRRDEPVGDDPSLDFLNHFLPAVQRALFGEAPLPAERTKS